MSEKMNIKERHSRIINVFKTNPGICMSSKVIAKKAGIILDKDCGRATIIRDLNILKERDTNIQVISDVAPYNCGFVYILPPEPAKKVKMPEMIDNRINVNKNKDGYKDPTASKVIKSIEPLSVYPGGVYVCATNTGETALYLALRGPFISNGVEKVTAVPVDTLVRNNDDNSIKISGCKNGKTLTVRPFEIHTKPTKYFKYLEDEILECDINNIKKTISDFLDIPKEVEYKTIEKIVKEKVEVPVTATNPDEALELEIYKCKAKVYGDCYRMAIEAFANAKKGNDQNEPY